MRESIGWSKDDRCSGCRFLVRKLDVSRQEVGIDLLGKAVDARPHTERTQRKARHSPHRAAGKRDTLPKSYGFRKEREGEGFSDWQKWILKQNVIRGVALPKSLFASQELCQGEIASDH